MSTDDEDEATRHKKISEFTDKMQEALDENADNLMILMERMHGKPYLSKKERKEFAEHFAIMVQSVAAYAAHINNLRHMWLQQVRIEHLLNEQVRLQEQIIKQLRHRLGE